MSVPSVADKFGNVWQYHSRSDRHSKVACWGIAFDLLEHSALLRAHAASGKVVLGVNQKMRDFATGREKNLDLVVARPSQPAAKNAPKFASLAETLALPLTSAQATALAVLPELPMGLVNAAAVLVALEAKATMTAHIKSLPRLYDELSSSHQCVHGASSQALAIGFSLINASEDFISTDLNKFDLGANDPVVSEHAQPLWAERTVAKVREISRRSSSSNQGFDALGIVVVDFRNDGSPVSLVAGKPGPTRGESDHYDGMIVRMANEYDSTFTRI